LSNGKNYFILLQEKCEAFATDGFLLLPDHAEFALKYRQVGIQRRKFYQEQRVVIAIRDSNTRQGPLLICSQRT